jgi:hypothetical protein
MVEATATINLALPAGIVSKAISLDCRVVALHAFFRNFHNQETFGCSPLTKRQPES